MKVIPENAVTMTTAEACLVVDSLVGDDLFHFVHSFSTLDADVFHHCGCSNLIADVHTAHVVAKTRFLSAFYFNIFKSVDTLTNLLQNSHSTI